MDATAVDSLAAPVAHFPYPSADELE